MKGKDMFNKDDYLKTPESFNLMVENCVKEQLEKEEGVISMSRYKRSKVRARQQFVKIAVAVLVACVVVGGGALAARRYQLAKIIGEDMGPNLIEEEKIQIIEEKQSVSENLPATLSEIRPDLESKYINGEEPLAIVKEAYFDGSKLYIYAEATDYGEQFADNMGADHVYINGELRAGGVYKVDENMNISFEGTKNSLFYGELQLADMELDENFSVEVFFTAFDDQVIRSTLVFDVEVTDVPAVIEEQRVEIDNGYVKILKLSLSDTTTHIQFEWHLTGEDAQEKIIKLSESEIAMQDSFGNAVDALLASVAPNGAIMYSLSPSEVIQNMEDGSWYTSHEYYLSGMSTDTEYLTIIPYVLEFDEDDKTYQGDDLEFGKFTVEIR